MFTDYENMKGTNVLFSSRIKLQLEEHKKLSVVLVHKLSQINVMVSYSDNEG